MTPGHPNGSPLVPARVADSRDNGNMSPTDLKAAVIVVSDEIVAGERENRSGPVAIEALAAHDVAAEGQVVGDDVTAISEAVQGAITAGHRIVITCGGTGVGPSDVTADAVAPLLNYELPGIVEEIRRRGLATTSIALVSREIAGVIRDGVHPPTFVLAAPGSRGGVRDAVAVVGPVLHYLIRRLDDDNEHSTDG